MAQAPGGTTRLKYAWTLGSFDRDSERSPTHQPTNPPILTCLSQPRPLENETIRAIAGHEIDDAALGEADDGPPVWDAHALVEPELRTDDVVDELSAPRL